MYRIVMRRPNGPGQDYDIGNIETQQLPGERVLITLDFKPRYPPRELKPEEAQTFQQYAQALYIRLAQLGFVPLPEVEKIKRPFGFVGGS